MGSIYSPRGFERKGYIHIPCSDSNPKWQSGRHCLDQFLKELRLKPAVVFSLSFFASFFLSLCEFCGFVDNPKTGRPPHRPPPRSWRWTHLNAKNFPVFTLFLNFVQNKSRRAFGNSATDGIALRCKTQNTGQDRYALPRPSDNR